jgi:acid phosphatase (class A)
MANCLNGEMVRSGRGTMLAAAKTGGTTMRVPRRHGAMALALSGLFALASTLPFAAADPVETHSHAPTDAAHCVDASTLDLGRILPPPPAAGSAQERAELDELLHIQATRTPAQVDQAQKDAQISIFRFADALGNPRGFTEENLPLTLKLFHDVGVDESTVSSAAKREFARPRPFTIESRLDPVVARPPSASYPSGHSTWAYVTALVLADMVPERRSQILARADEFAHNRAVAGVHYPSDVEAGHLAGTTLAAMLFVCQPFETEEAAARSELRKALDLPH